jgi:hypothetical protein
VSDHADDCGTCRGAQLAERARIVRDLRKLADAIARGARVEYEHHITRADVFDGGVAVGADVTTRLTIKVEERTLIR